MKTIRAWPKVTCHGFTGSGAVDSMQRNFKEEPWDNPDPEPGFNAGDIQALDAPDYIPAGSAGVYVSRE